MTVSKTPKALLLLVILALAAAVVVAGCGGSSGTTTESAPAEEQAPAEEAAPEEAEEEPAEEAEEPAETEEEEPAEEEQEAGGQEAGGAQSSLAAEGKTIFGANCATCHTLKAAGATGTVGPNLDELEPSLGAVEQQVINGGGPMPAFGKEGTLNTKEIKAVSTYVTSVAGKG